jgi:hypothetical protein
MSHWHPSVIAALVGFVVLPVAWYLHTSHWLIAMFQMMGRRALASGDVQDGLDTMALVYQLALTGGVPLLFALHLLSRMKRINHVLLWLLVPLLFVGTAFGIVLIGTIFHH